MGQEKNQWNAFLLINIYNARTLGAIERNKPRASKTGIETWNDGFKVLNNLGDLEIAVINYPMTIEKIYPPFIERSKGYCTFEFDLVFSVFLSHQEINASVGPIV